jgi:hypothetical protein
MHFRSECNCTTPCLLDEEHTSVFAKLLAIILITICTALALLSLRQSRIDIVNKMTHVHRNAMRQRLMVWTARERLAELLQSDQLHSIVGNPDNWSILEQPRPQQPQPIPHEPTDADRG